MFSEYCDQKNYWKIIFLKWSNLARKKKINILGPNFLDLKLTQPALFQTKLPKAYAYDDIILGPNFFDSKLTWAQSFSNQAYPKLTHLPSFSELVTTGLFVPCLGGLGANIPPSCLLICLFVCGVWFACCIGCVYFLKQACLCHVWEGWVQTFPQLIFGHGRWQ